MGNIGEFAMRSLVLRVIAEVFHILVSFVVAFLVIATLRLISASYPPEFAIMEPK